MGERNGEGTSELSEFGKGNGPRPGPSRCGPWGTESGPSGAPVRFTGVGQVVAVGKGANLGELGKRIRKGTSELSEFGKRNEA